MTARRSTDQQSDLFVPYISDLPLRDQRETMERPFFSLAKRKRLKPIEYVSPTGEVFVNVFPNAEFGMATIWDADVLIWAASQLNNLRKQAKNDLPRTLQFQPYDLLKTIGRLTGGHQYRPAARGSRPPAGDLHRYQHPRPERQEAPAVQLDRVLDRSRGRRNSAEQGYEPDPLSWFYEGILMDGGLLSIDPVYFTITGGRERWLYRVARKHAGGAGEGGFAISLPTLFEKSGAGGTIAASSAPQQWTGRAKRQTAACGRIVPLMRSADGHCGSFQ